MKTAFKITSWALFTIAGVFLTYSMYLRGWQPDRVEDLANTLWVTVLAYMLGKIAQNAKDILD